MIDVLAFPLAEAAAILDQAGIKWESQRCEPKFRRCGLVTGRGNEYVVRQQWLDNHKVVLTTGIKYRKEVLNDGLEDR